MTKELDSDKLFYHFLAAAAVLGGLAVNNSGYLSHGVGISGMVLQITNEGKIKSLLKDLQDFFVSADFECRSCGYIKVFGIGIRHPPVIKDSPQYNSLSSESFWNYPAITLHPFLKRFQPVFDIFCGIPLSIREIAVRIDECTVIDAISLGQTISLYRIAVPTVSGIGHLFIRGDKIFVMGIIRIWWDFYMF
jgi:hypothetical protein